jgi:hypothetical protein
MAQSTWVTHRGDCTHSIWLGQGCIVPIPHGLADTTLYLYHMGQLVLYCTCTAWVSQGYIVPIPHRLANVWQPLLYISPAYFGNTFTYIWYIAYYICLGLIFQCKFNDVYFVIGLPYLVIILGTLDIRHITHVQALFFNVNSTVMFVLWLDYLVILANAIIRVSKTTSAYSVWYISRLQFSLWIWIWSHNVIP